MLSVDEAVWLDNFYRCNITPLFFVETLADIEKQATRGRSPEPLVGALAFKTPDMQSVANVHHRTSLWAELSGQAPPVLEKLGRPQLGHGQPVWLGDGAGMIFHSSPEEDALHRWQRGEFLDLERQTAKKWRQELREMDLEQTARKVAAFGGNKIAKTIPACKILADEMLNLWDQASMLYLCLALVGISEPHASRINERWRRLGKPPSETSPRTYAISVPLISRFTSQLRRV